MPKPSKSSNQPPLEEMATKAAHDSNLSQAIQMIIWNHAGEGNKYKNAMAASFEILSLIEAEVAKGKIEELENLKKKDFMTGTIIDEPTFTDPNRLGVDDMFSAVRTNVINDRISELSQSIKEKE